MKINMLMLLLLFIMLTRECVMYDTMSISNLLKEMRQP
jgi:hypothetical protein